MWQELEKYTEEFTRLEIGKVLNFEEFNRIAIVHHSSSMEGSTLTLEESTLLITEGITAKGKPMSEHLMVKDHYDALNFILDEAKKKTTITPAFLQQVNAAINKNNGIVRQTALGVCDDTKGDFRLGNVTAGSTYFVNYDKVIPMVNELCPKLQHKINEVKTVSEIYRISFDAHFYLVNIHPWFDGNGRTSRLLMNFIQAYHNMPLSIVFVEDKPQYIKALNDARAAGDMDIFRNFMCSQQVKYLQQEIEKFNHRNKGMSFLL